jgi:hypothetical protein
MEVTDHGHGAPVPECAVSMRPNAASTENTAATGGRTSVSTSAPEWTSASMKTSTSMPL